MEDILLIYFEQIVSFWTQIQTNSSYFVNTYNNSCLTSATNTERVIFQVNSWKYYLNPKLFYLNAIRDKFHVCNQIVFSLRITIGCSWWLSFSNTDSRDRMQSTSGIFNFVFAGRQSLSVTLGNVDKLSFH